jgi:opacity protein-like surface antigen
MRKIILASLTAVIVSAGAAQADPYVSILGGADFTPSQAVGAGRSGMETGWNLGARVGSDMGSYWNGAPSGLSVEGDLFYHQSHYAASATHLDSGSLMANLIYHVNTDSPLGIYGGAGLGPVMTQVSTPAGQDSQTVFGWQAIAGVEHPLADSNANIFAEYRYQDAHWANVGGLTHVGNTSDNVSVGVKFNM